MKNRLTLLVVMLSHRMPMRKQSTTSCKVDLDRTTEAIVIVRRNHKQEKRPLEVPEYLNMRRQPKENLVKTPGK